MTHKVTIYTKAPCPYCDMAKKLLIENKIEFEEMFLDDPVIRSNFKRDNPTLKTAPQIFVDRVLLQGGFTGLNQYIENYKRGDGSDNLYLFST